MKKIAAIFLGIIILWGIYNYLYGPKLKHISEYKKSLKAIEAEFSIYKNDENIIRKTPEKGFPKESELPYIVEDFISNAGKGLSIDYSLIAPQDASSQGIYKTIPIKLNFECNYTGLSIFLNNIENMEYPFRVTDMKITKTGSYPSLYVRMTVAAFVSPGFSSGKTQKQFSADKSEVMMDPFFNSATLSTTFEVQAKQYIEPVLSGIWFGENPKAIINDETLGKGDSIDGYKITTIYPDKVVLFKNNKSVTLKLKGD